MSALIAAYQSYSKHGLAGLIQAASAARPAYVGMGARGAAYQAAEDGATAWDASRFEEAVIHFDRAIELRPDFTFAHACRAGCLNDLKRHDEALASYAAAGKLQPSNAEIQFGESGVHLLLGDFERGWRQFEFRWKTQRGVNEKLKMQWPLWLGDSSIEGKTILLWAEQGFGDMIQFCRYVPMVRAMGANVILYVQKPLRKLMSSLDDGLHVISETETLPAIDFHCPLMSLPLAFGTRLETIPADVPYLRAPSSERDWPTMLGPNVRPRIGICWAGNPWRPAPDDRRSSPDCQRSMPLKMLTPLFEIDATLISLVKDVRKYDVADLAESPIIDFSQHLKTYADTAALISELDFVITVDTSVAHLAGALGKLVWIMIPYVSCWRWLLDREDSPWYPTARLFRQSTRNEWAPVIERVRAAAVNREWSGL